MRRTLFTIFIFSFFLFACGENEIIEQTYKDEIIKKEDSSTNRFDVTNPLLLDGRLVFRDEDHFDNYLQKINEIEIEYGIDGLKSLQSELNFESMLGHYPEYNEDDLESNGILVDEAGLAALFKVNPIRPFLNQ